MKITLVGSALTIEEKIGFTIITMKSEQIPALPKGIPTPSATTTRYTVYIGGKQWKKVVEAAKDKEDILILEGYPVWSKDCIIVYVTSATSKKIQIALKAKQQEQAAGV